MLCFILICSHRILVFKNIFGYFFQKGYFKGSTKKRAHRQKTLRGGGGADNPLAPLLQRAWLKIPKMSWNGNRHISSLWRHLKKCDGPLGYMKFNSGCLYRGIIDNTNKLFWYTHATKTTMSSSQDQHEDPHDQLLLQYEEKTEDLQIFRILSSQ